MLLNFIIIVAAIFYAYKNYAKKSVSEENSSALMQAIVNKFYIDEFYERTIVKTLYKLSRLFDTTINKHLIDDTINRISSSYILLSVAMKNIQNGQVQYYLFYIMSGISALLIYLSYIMEL